MQVQDRMQLLVYSLGEGAGRTLLRGLIVAVLVVLLFVAFTTSQFRGLRDAGSMELAQVARQLAGGHGFTTRCLHPGDLAALAKAGRPPPDPAQGMPDVRHAPLHPASLAAGLRLMGPNWDVPTMGRPLAAETRVLLPLGFGWTLLTALLLYIAGARFFAPRVGAVAALTYVTSEQVLGAVLVGGSVPLESFLTTATLCAAAFAVRLRSAQWHPAAWVTLAIIAGVCGGLAALTAYALVIVPLLAALLIGSGIVRWRTPVVTALLVASIVIIAPWLVRNYHVSGHVLGTATHLALNGTSLFGEQGWDRTVATDLSLRTMITAVQTKAALSFAAITRDQLHVLGDGLIMSFFLVALFIRFDDELTAALKWVLALGLVLRVVIASFGQPYPGFLLPFLPLVSVIAAALLFKLLDQATFLMEPSRNAVVFCWLGIAALPLCLTLANAPARVAYPPYAPPVIQYVSRLLASGEVLATDIPWAAAWYGDRVAVQIPRTPDDLLTMRSRGLPVAALYLTTATGDQPYISGLVQGREQGWLPILNQLVPEGFPWQHAFTIPPGRRDQIFLTDSSRWEKAP